MCKALLLGLNRYIILGGLTLENLSYKLTIIEDEEVPLASAPMNGGAKYLPITLALMLAILIGAVISIYYFRCRYYQKRILELDAEKLKAYSGWNLKKLKEATLEIEMEAVDYK